MNRGTRSQKKFGLNLKPTAGWVALLAATSYGCGAKDDGGGSGDGDGDGDLNGAGGSGASSGGGEGSGGAQGTGGATTGGGNGSCAFETCDGSCVDTQTDDLNCGDCGELCDEHHACQSGNCMRVSCPGSLTVCEGSCTHTGFDRHHCGGCSTAGGVACDVDEACVGGNCTTIPIPGATYCSDTTNWPIAYTTLEFQILDIVNQRRAEGANCGASGYFPPVGPLQMDSSLRCSARMHSKDMVDRDYFSHTNPEGDGPRPRMEAAGYSGSGFGENIAAGNATAAQTMDQWMNSSGHCSNIMNEDYTLIGIGYYPGMGAEYGHYWTQNFGRN